MHVIHICRQSTHIHKSSFFSNVILATKKKGSWVRQTLPPGAEVTLGKVRSHVIPRTNPSLESIELYFVIGQAQSLSPVYSKRIKKGKPKPGEDVRILCPTKGS